MLPMRVMVMGFDRRFMVSYISSTIAWKREFYFVLIGSTGVKLSTKEMGMLCLIDASCPRGKAASVSWHEDHFDLDFEEHVRHCSAKSMDIQSCDLSHGILPIPNSRTPFSKCGAKHSTLEFSKYVCVRNTSKVSLPATK